MDKEEKNENRILRSLCLKGQVRNLFNHMLGVVLVGMEKEGLIPEAIFQMEAESYIYSKIEREVVDDR